MYTYICPHCGCKNYTELTHRYTDEYFKYRTDVCATATCHKSVDNFDPFSGKGGYVETELDYLVVTSTDICNICPGRLDCMCLPVVVAEIVTEKVANTLIKRDRSWRDTIRDEQRIRSKRRRLPEVLRDDES